MRASWRSFAHGGSQARVEVALTQLRPGGPYVSTTRLRSTETR